MRDLEDFELPSFPSVAHDLLSALKDPSLGNQDIAAILEHDPALSVAVLRSVNSAGTGLRHKVDNLAQAISLLGRTSLEGMVIAVAVSSSIPKVNHPSFNAQRFWGNAAVRANAAKVLAKKMNPGLAFESYTAALLQDMAIPFLLDRRKEYGDIFSRWRKDAKPLFQIEQSEFGWDHAVVAAWICDKWQLPETLSAAITGHHGTEVDGFDSLLASQAAAFIDDGVEEERLSRFIKAVEVHGYTEEEAQKILETATENATELSSILSR